MKRTLYLLILLITALACNNTSTEANKEINQIKQNSDSSLVKAKPLKNNPEDSLNIIIQAEPNNVLALLMRARINFNQGDRRQAIFDVQRLQDIDSLNPKMLLLLGEIQMQKNQSREAKNSWERCAAADPRAIECRLKLGQMYASLNEHKKALRFLDEVIEIDEYIPSAYFFKGIVIRNYKQDTALALNYFQKAIELKQDYFEALDMMGVSLAAMGDTLAPYYYQRILDIDSNRADIYYKMGVYYKSKDDLNKAIEAYTKSTQIDAKYSDSYYNLGVIFVDLKEFQDARNYFAQAIKARPRNNYKAYYGKAYCFEMLGDIINAKKDYRKSLEQLPLYKPAMEGLARVNQ
ncbi:MAG: tetratricopeptide (TPR) repeat protein [Roseivirga sp.]|jgi:tetratricopeptide (TPR) repeat protein